MFSIINSVITLQKYIRETMLDANRLINTWILLYEPIHSQPIAVLILLFQLSSHMIATSYFLPPYKLIESVIKFI